MAHIACVALLALLACAIASDCAAASAQFHSGDIVLTDPIARTLQVRDSKASAKYAVKNTIKLPSAAKIGHISQTAVTSSGLAFTTALRGTYNTKLDRYTGKTTSFLIVSRLGVKGGKALVFEVPGLQPGQGSLSKCAIASGSQSYGKVAVAKAAGPVYNVWLLVDCTACKASDASNFDSSKILPFNFNSAHNTLDSSRGLQYTPTSGGCSSFTPKGYYVSELGTRGSNLTAITEPINSKTDESTQQQLVHFYNGKRIATLTSSDDIAGGFSLVAQQGGFDGYSDFFGVALRGVTPSSTTPPQYAVVQYAAGKKPKVVGGIHPLPSSGTAPFAPALATRSGSRADPLYLYSSLNDSPSKKPSVFAIDKRVAGKRKQLFGASVHIIDLDVVP